MVDLREFVVKNSIFILFIGLGISLCIIGVIQYFASKTTPKGITFTSVEEVDNQQESKIKISIDIEGKVMKPGVYQLDEDSRLQDALIASGGLSTSADRDYVSRRINLAQKLADGSKIYIPAVGEFDNEEVVLGSSTSIESINADVAIQQEEDSGLINVNSASIDSLDTLPKVGPVTAQKIVSSRPYGTIEELVTKKVLTQKTFDGLRDKIAVQ